MTVIVEAFDKKYGQALPAGQTLDDIFGDTSQYDSLRAVRKKAIHRRQFKLSVAAVMDICLCVLLPC